eukprot:scaffold32620_cov76-Amphora_coffeaeformis.AAC.1
MNFKSLLGHISNQATFAEWHASTGQALNIRVSSCCNKIWVSGAFPVQAAKCKAVMPTRSSDRMKIGPFHGTTIAIGN